MASDDLSACVTLEHSLAGHAPPSTQVPAPSHASHVQMLASAMSQIWPDGSYLQPAEQQSRPSVLPSSHCSPASRKALPQLLLPKRSTVSAVTVPSNELVGW